MMNIAPIMAATAANIAPPATPRSVTNNMCASLFAVVLELPREQLGQEVPVAVSVPAGTGAVAYTRVSFHASKEGEGEKYRTTSALVRRSIVSERLTRSVVDVSLGGRGDCR